MGLKRRVARTKPPVPNKGKTVKNSHTSPRAIIHQAKIAEALEYRRMGHSYPKIGEAMKMTATYAYNLVSEGMEQMVEEPAQAVLEMELHRLDEMQAAVYPDAVAGDHSAINSVLRIQERRAKLMGFDTIKFEGRMQTEHTETKKIEVIHYVIVDPQESDDDKLIDVTPHTIQ